MHAPFCTAACRAAESYVSILATYYVKADEKNAFTFSLHLLVRDHWLGKMCMKKRGRKYNKIASMIVLSDGNMGYHLVFGYL